MLEAIQACFRSDRILFTKHAKDEMENEESGEIRENEVSAAVLTGKMIETYPEDEPYPSCLIYGRTSANRPLHIVCAYAKEHETAIIITTYEPDADRWIDFKRRRT
jgi:hypothetical protein